MSEQLLARLKEWNRSGKTYSAVRRKTGKQKHISTFDDSSTSSESRACMVERIVDKPENFVLAHNYVFRVLPSLVQSRGVK